MKRVEVQKQDLIRNLNIIKEISDRNGPNDKNEPFQIICVIKGNGRGLGLVQLAEFLQEEGFDFLAVSTVEEVMAVREAQIAAKLLMLSSTCIKEEVEKLIEENAILTIGSQDAARVANEIAKKLEKRIPVHLKIDTGMGRHGFVADRKEELLLAMQDMTHLEIQGTYSHFSKSFSKDSKWTKLQFEKFLSVIEMLRLNKIDPGMLHVCNSAAFFKYPYMHLNAARLGAGMHGRISGLDASIYGLKKVGVLKSNISEIKILPKGYNIGYGNFYQTKKEARIATVQIGYFDGFGHNVQEQLYHPLAKLRIVYHSMKNFLKDNNLTVTIEGKEYPIIGQIGMNHVSIDITGTNFEVGQVVEFPTSPVYVERSIRREYK